MLKATELDSCIWGPPFQSPHISKTFFSLGEQGGQHLSTCPAWGQGMGRCAVRGCVDRCVSVWICVCVCVCVDRVLLLMYMKIAYSCLAHVTFYAVS